MKKIGDITNTADKNGEFTDGNVAAGTPPTQLMGAWFNSVQREILNVLAKAGVPQSATKEDQLAEAITKLVASAGYLPTGYSYSKSESDGRYQSKGDYATNAALNNGLGLKFDKAGGTTTGNITVPSFTVRNPKVDLWLNFYPASSSESGNYAYFQYGNSSGTGGKIGIPRTNGSEMFTFAIAGDSYTKGESNNLFANKTVTQLQQFNSIVSGKRTVQAENNSLTFGLYIDPVKGAFLTGMGEDGNHYGELAHPMDKKSGTIMRVEEALGVNQKYKDVASNRAAGVTYTNTNRKPIFVSVSSTESRVGAIVRLTLYVDNVIASEQSIGGGGGNNLDIWVTKKLITSAVVPSGSTYRVVVENESIGRWTELS